MLNAWSSFFGFYLHNTFVSLKESKEGRREQTIGAM
jgi:hypothetical protein